jgi:hypothetical protein
MCQKSCPVRPPLLVLLTILVAGCVAAPPGPSDEEIPAPLDLERSQSQTRDGVTVQISIPTEAQVERLFGTTLAESGIQPIWLRIENTSDTDYWLLPIAIDPDYYSADEVALVVRSRLPKEERDAAADTFRSNALQFFVGAGKAIQGYVYASYLRGGRYVDVRLAGHRQGVRMRFAVLLPTEGFDYERSALRQLYAKRDFYPDLTADELRRRLRELACCTTDSSGMGEGDPLNVVLVGSGEEAVAALSSSGWTFTEAITVDSVRRMVGAAIAERSFLTAPVSSLYAFGRRQDLALQRGRTTISQRNHMRLWLAPFRCEGRPVWVGQVSRDIGVKTTTKSPTLTTHVIDPVVDESREYLLNSLLHRDSVSRFAFVQGAGESSRDKPRRNLTGDPYFTDGMRLVVWLSSEPVPPEQAVNLHWNESTDPVLEARGEYSKVPSSGD